MAEDEVEKLSEDTLEHLDQVRKGKPRKFVMLCKGPKILGLIVFKKGPYEKHIKAAKKSAGSGTPYFGIVDGGGPNINFKLSRADGFDKEPVKTTVLKSFLAEEAEYKAMPVIEIVSELGPMLDGDDPLVQRFTKLQESALAACDSHPDRAAEINALCLKIGKTLDSDEAQSADSQILELENLLKSLADSGNVAESTTKSPDPKELAKLTDELKRLQPEIELLVKAGAGDIGRLKGLLADIAIDRQAGDIASALNRCKEISDYLKDEWVKQSGRAQDRVDAILAGSFTERSGDVEKIKTVFGFAKERASEGRYGSGLVALLNLSKLIDAAEKNDAPKDSDVIEKGTVEARKKLVQSRWQETVRNVRMEIGALRPAIDEQNPDEDADELVGAIDAAIFDFCSDFNDAIFALGKAKEGDRRPLERMLAVIEDYQKQIDESPLLQHLASSRESLGVDLDVSGALRKALNDIRLQLEA